MTADSTDPSRIDLLARIIAARGAADPALADRLRREVNDAEVEEIRSSIERDLQYVAEQRLVALAVELGLARAELATDPAVPADSKAIEEADRTEAMREAERWLRTAAEAGSHLAQFNLGALLVRRGQPEDAEHWFRKATRTDDTGLAARAREALDRIRGNLR